LTSPRQHKISFEEMAQELVTLSPSMSDWCPISEEWETVSITEIDKLIALYPSKQWMKDYPCGWIARGFSVDVARHFADGSGLIKAVGVAHCTRLMGKDLEPLHTVNIFRTPDRLYLLDMQTKEYWPAVKGQDEFYFVEM